MGAWGCVYEARIRSSVAASALKTVASPKDDHGPAAYVSPPPPPPVEGRFKLRRFTLPARKG
jgi:hypothetical protein